jgi:DNA-binding IclR family transcriptional regulator
MAAAKQSKTTPEVGNLTGSLARGLGIVNVLLHAPQPLNITEIAAATQLDQSSTLRLVRTLEEHGYIVPIIGSKRYAASPQAIQSLPLMHPVQQLRREAHTMLTGLAMRLTETVVLVLYLGAERMAIDISQCPGSLAPYYSTWLRGPLHATGAGKALLLSLSRTRRHELLGPAPYAATTPFTLTERDALDADLEASAERGFVVAIDQHRLGLTTVAANIADWHGAAIGCLVVTGHTRNFEADRVTRIGQEVIGATELLLYQAPSLGAVAHFLGHTAISPEVPARWKTGAVRRKQ